jgi:hypothetical protein
MEVVEMATRPMSPAEIRRLMRVELDERTLIRVALREAHAWGMISAFRRLGYFDRPVAR